MSNTNKLVKKVDLALQGGGAHGAFTWGVLDRLVEEKDLHIEGISGTSAGAMNAAAMVYGHAKNGVDGAKESLEFFWKKVSQAASLGPFQRSIFDILSGQWTLDYSPGFIAYNLMAGMMSPYQFNLTGYNPLAKILEETIDFDELAKAPIHLFVTATNARTGRGRVFHNEEVTCDVLMASACLPNLYQAIEIDGDPYWDGGYSGNPSISPLILECESEDTILIQINPVERPGTPRTPGEIMNRLNEISFNATLIKELHMIALLRRVVNPQDEEGKRWATMRLHLINSDVMTELGYSSKLNAEWSFLTKLRDEGRRAAEQFITEHKASIGKRSSLNIDRILADSLKAKGKK